MKKMILLASLVIALAFMGCAMGQVTPDLSGVWASDCGTVLSIAGSSITMEGRFAGEMAISGNEMDVRVTQTQVGDSMQAVEGGNPGGTWTFALDGDVLTIAENDQSLSFARQ